MESLDASHGVLTRHDVTAVVGGENQERHPLTVVELAGGKIIGDLRVVATADNVVVGGLQRLFGVTEPQTHYTLRCRFRIPKFHRGTALLLSATNSENYYHWLLESLARWKILQAAGCSDYDFVLLGNQPSRFQDETMDRLGVPLAKRLRCSKNFTYQFERLIVPAMPFPPENVPDWVCMWLRALFPPGKAGPEKIYLSRRGANRRRLVNEAELEVRLAGLGFTCVQPERLSVAQQVELLSAARCVVAPHGAALTNMVFAPPGAMLLELFHPQHKNHCIKHLAAACGHYYTSVDGHPSNRAGDKEQEYSIDVSAVLETLKLGI
jgi:capsular polysaccharide biosynthesis protein